VVDELDKCEEDRDDCGVDKPGEQSGGKDYVEDEGQREQEEPGVHVDCVDEEREVGVVEPAAGERRPHALEEHLD